MIIIGMRLKMSFEFYTLTSMILSSRLMQKKWICNTESGRQDGDATRDWRELSDVSKKDCPISMLLIEGTSSDNLYHSCHIMCYYLSLGN